MSRATVEAARVTKRETKIGLFCIMAGLCMLFSVKEVVFVLPLLFWVVTLHLPRVLGIVLIGFGLDVLEKYGGVSHVYEISLALLAYMGLIFDSFGEWPSAPALRLLMLALYIIGFGLFMLCMRELAKDLGLERTTRLPRRAAFACLCIYGIAILFINLCHSLISSTGGENLPALTAIPLLLCGFETLRLLHVMIFFKGDYVGQYVGMLILALAFWAPFALQVTLALWPAS